MSMGPMKYIKKKLVLNKFWQYQISKGSVHIWWQIFFGYFLPIPSTCRYRTKKLKRFIQGLVFKGILKGQESGRYTSPISKKYLILFRTQMLRIFLILSVYTVFTSFFLTALEPKSVNGGVTNQQKPTKTKKNFPLVLNLLFKTNTDCFC